MLRIYYKKHNIYKINIDYKINVLSNIYIYCNMNRAVKLFLKVLQDIYIRSIF